MTSGGLWLLFALFLVALNSLFDCARVARITARREG